VADQPDAATQAKARKTAALSMIVGGLFVGFGFPTILVAYGIEIFKTPGGFDYIWLVSTALMLVDFVLAAYFWRRGDVLDRSAQGLPPRS
jgi:hypothetical protein